MSFFALPNELLHQISVYLDRQDVYSLSLACRQFHYQFFNEYLYVFNFITCRHSKALFCAAENGLLSVVSRILELIASNFEIDAEFPYAPFDPFAFSRKNKACLLLAISHKHFDVVQLLLEHGADPLRRDPSGKAPLDAALASGHDGIIEAISSHVQDIQNYLVDSEERYTALHCASRYGRSYWVRHFLEKGIDIDAKDKDGRTALRHAIGTDFLGFCDDTNTSLKPNPIQISETVKVLVKFGANPIFEIYRWWGIPDNSRVMTAANVGLGHIDPKVRALFIPNASIARAVLPIEIYREWLSLHAIPWYRDYPGIFSPYELQ